MLDTAEDTFVSLFSGTTLVAKLDVTGSNESETSNNKTPNEFTVLDFDGAKGDSLFVSFSESGALGEFNATVVPVPASLPLLVGGFGLMAFMRRRRKE